MRHFIPNCSPSVNIYRLQLTSRGDVAAAADVTAIIDLSLSVCTIIATTFKSIAYCITRGNNISATANALQRLLRSGDYWFAIAQLWASHIVSRHVCLSFFLSLHSFFLQNASSLAVLVAIRWYFNTMFSYRSVFFADSWSRPYDVSYDVIKFIYCHPLLCSV